MTDTALRRFEQPAPHTSAAALVLRWSARLLVAASWASAALFGLYILAFYGGVALGDMGDWNHILPRLYEPATPAATLAIGAHFVTGGVLLVLGPIQLIGAVRRHWPALHRWTGRTYVLAAAIAGVGGLGFILAKGTVGGTAMDLGFGLYGALMVVAAAEAYRHARARRFERHRIWAMRLYALAVGSWLYRMDYGFWQLFTGGIGRTADFRGTFDVVMCFAFYLPNLLVAELFLRARRAPDHPGFQLAAAGVLTLAALLVLAGSYFFTVYIWWPGILHGVAGQPLPGSA